MKYIIALLSLVFATNAYAETAVKVGGTVVAGEGVVATAGLDFTLERGAFQYNLDGDYTLKTSEGVTKKNFGDIEGKINYAVDDRNYMFTIARFDYNQFRVNQEKAIVGFGFGQKLVRTKNTKVSNEISFAVLHNDSGEEPIIRNSLWIAQKLDDKSTFVNKFLIEQGTETYILNKTSLKYAITPAVSFGVDHTFMRDPHKNTNVTGFSLGVNF